MVEKVERKRQLRAKRRAAWLCVDCGAPAYGYYRCEYHRKKQRHYQIKVIEKRRKSGRCISCGLVLERDFDTGKVTCAICNERATIYNR